MADRFAPAASRAGVSIGRLGLSLPAANAAAGERLAARVGRALAERLPPDAAGHLGHLELTVRPAGTGEAAVVDAVVEAVLRAFRRVE